MNLSDLPLLQQSKLNETGVEYQIDKYRAEQQAEVPSVQLNMWFSFTPRGKMNRDN